MHIHIKTFHIQVNMVSLCPPILIFFMGVGIGLLLNKGLSSALKRKSTQLYKVTMLLEQVQISSILIIPVS